MKKIKIVSSALITAIILTSCATTSESANSQATNSHSKDKAPKEIVIEESPEDIFIKSLEGLSITKVSSPKEITKGKKFSEPFVFSASKADQTPAEGLSLTLEYPAAKAEGKITFEKTVLTTDSEGKITFTPEDTSFAAKTSIKVYPTPLNDDESLLKRLEPFTASADYKVKSDIASKGAVLFVWDFNEKDRPVNNSYNIQAEFRGRGITLVGNGPIGETSYIGKPKALYKDTYDIIGGSAYGYLIYGTIKFEEPVTALEDESGYYCILKAEIEAVNMKNGSLVYSSVTTYESKGKNWNECVSNGKDKLSELVVSDIMYGL